MNPWADPKKKAAIVHGIRLAAKKRAKGIGAKPKETKSLTAKTVSKEITTRRRWCTDCSKWITFHAK